MYYVEVWNPASKCWDRDPVGFDERKHAARVLDEKRISGGRVVRDEMPATGGKSCTASTGPAS